METSQDLLISNLSYSQDKNRLVEDMYRKINRIISTVNNKDSAIYSNTPFITGGSWYIGLDPKKSASLSRKVISFGALPNTATTSVAHQLNGALTINNNWKVIPEWGRSFDPTGGITISIFHPQITMTIDNTNINITTTADFSAYTETEICLMYTRA